MEFDFTAAIANGNSAFDAAGLTDFYVELVKIPALGAMRVGNMPDVTRIGKLIGWRPTVGLDDILRRVIDFERGRVARDDS